jgi:large subunit ribosomal protein L24e
MTVDSTLNFAARRNIPIRYNRELVKATLKGMKRIEEIRLKREANFYRQRMRGTKTRDLENDKKLVQENQHLLPPQERDNYVSLADQMDVDEQMISGEEEVSELDSEEEEVSEEEIQQPIKIKSRLPKSKLKHKMKVGGGLEVE